MVSVVSINFGINTRASIEIIFKEFEIYVLRGIFLNINSLEK